MGDIAGYAKPSPNVNKYEKWLQKFNFDKIFVLMLIVLEIGTNATKF